MVKKDMEEEIKKFKQENGNNNFTQKDLLMYIVRRIDDLPCEEHLQLVLEKSGDIKEIKAQIKQWKWTAGILLTLILTLIGVLHV